MARHAFKKWVAGSILLLLAFIIVAAAPSTPAFAQATGGWDSVPLTANFTTNKEPQIQGQHVVWSAHDGIDWEIILYDLSSNATRQLTNDAVDQTDPVLDRNHVLWVAHEQTGPILVLYDLSTGTPTRLPQSEGVQGAAEIKGDLVVWKGGALSSSIYLYDIAAGTTTRLTTDDRAYSSPLTDGRYVVFESAPSAQMDGPTPAYNPLSQVMLYDYRTKAFTPIGGSGASRPDLAGGLVVWQEGIEKTAEILLYDATTGAITRLTENQIEDVAPVVGGEKVAWLEWGRADDMSMPHDSPWKVMVYDRTSGQTTVATENSLSVDIQDDGALLLWSHWNMGPTYVAYDITTGVSEQLEPSGLAAFGASLDGGRAVWIGYPGFRLEDDRMLYLSAREGLPPGATPPTSPIRQFADIGDSPYAAAIQQLAEEGLARGYRTALPLTSVDFYELRYRPEAPTLRWQFLKMLLGVAGIDARNHTQQPPFKDVQGLQSGEDHNIRYYVQAGLDTGIMHGLDTYRFAPFGSLTRAQAVTAVVRAARNANASGFNWLIDPPGKVKAPTFVGTLGDFSPVHAQNMRVAERNGLLAGLVGFGPDWDPWAPITRGEAAQLLVNLKTKL